MNTGPSQQTIINEGPSPRISTLLETLRQKHEAQLKRQSAMWGFDFKRATPDLALTDPESGASGPVPAKIMEWTPMFSRSE